MRVGIFGGTFDPPHLGHSILAAEARYYLAIDKLIWVLTPLPPHKLNEKITPLENRLALVKAAVRFDPSFELSSVEIDRPGPHFAVDTVRLLKNQYPDSEIFYIIGGDSLHDLPTWHAPKELVAECDAFGVMRRLDDQINIELLDSILPGLSAKVRFLDIPLIEISASMIRQRISEKRPFRYFVLPDVYQVILERGLYR
jgi:nicotinate-nucleotide adenylyltransferase